MKIKNIIYTILTIFFCSTAVLSAQQVRSDNVVAKEVTQIEKEGRTKRAWEIGIGGSVFQFSRIDFTNFQKLDDGYQIDLQLRQNVFGGNLYLARELSPHFYIDLQGTAGITKQWVNGKNENKYIAMVGPGLQWRFGEYFGSQYIDPYARVGVNYMRKNFDLKYTGTEGNTPEELKWVLENIYNKHGVDRHSMIPISLGLGMNTWLNDRFGIGFQGDYLLMPYKDVANSVQGTVRLMWRMGGKSKKAAPVVQYIEREVIVTPPPVEVEKIVEVEVPIAAEICELFNNIYFDFDKATITDESHETLDKIANILKGDTSRRYLITGYTDAWGSEEYNMDLSRRRVGAVVEELEKRGVPDNMMKFRGVGKKVAYAPKEASVDIRRGDRKVGVEIISNMDYWNYIPKSDLDR